MKSIVVFCGSSEGGNTEYGEAALALGSTMAEKDIQLVYGGAKIGIMGKVAEGVLQNGGKVIGVIPVFLKKKEVILLPYLHIVNRQTTYYQDDHSISHRNAHHILHC